MTPEARVKRLIRAVINKYGKHVWVHMPVPGGYGRPALDYMGYACGQGFAVEAKRLGGKPTERQKGIIEDLEYAGVKVFVVDGFETLRELDLWLARVTANRLSLSHSR